MRVRVRKRVAARERERLGYAKGVRLIERKIAYHSVAKIPYNNYKLEIWKMPHVNSQSIKI